MSLLTIDPLGDRGFLLSFEKEASAAAWARSVRDQGWPGIIDVVLAYRSLALFFDSRLTDADQLEARLRGLAPTAGPCSTGRTIDIPVLYDGPDLTDVAAHTGQSAARVIEEHSRTEYNVFAIGFLPGFPYAGYLPNSLTGIPRRAVPRSSVPPGSVAIAGKQTGIYPIESPGGWHLLGRTPLCISDLQTGYFPINAGDRIRFRPISAQEFEDRRNERL